MGAVACSAALSGAIAAASGARQETGRQQQEHQESHRASPFTRITAVRLESYSLGRGNRNRTHDTDSGQHQDDGYSDNQAALSPEVHSCPFGGCPGALPLSQRPRSWRHVTNRPDVQVTRGSCRRSSSATNDSDNARRRYPQYPPNRSTEIRRCHATIVKLQHLAGPRAKGSSWPQVSSWRVFYMPGRVARSLSPFSGPPPWPY